ncbi:hypothetical protein [Methylorubrum salsuginis]|uniref:Uncharacterized protein n=1 Tax=Methylorubrum salsuginis TaxID=414703 RepID=A0A1I4EF40_9HYPH|nr:hypothetical protein [Methylorubrum salsuginis]SFL02801.1 hypothetical protein SAMN04488125_107189 [Methylorubrum salsuginis]
MPLPYERMGSDGWVAQIGPVRLYLSDESGAVSRGQAALAEAVAGSLDARRAAASAYLDLFVDRRKACGDAEEPWWLDEIDFRARPGEAATGYAFLFTLHGDDGGLWTVDMHAAADGHRPYRFERRQG